MKKVLFSAIIFLLLLFTVVGCVTDLPSADTTGSETTSLDEPAEVITDEPTNEPDGTDETTTEPEEETTEPEEETTEPEEETTEPEEETTEPEEETTEPEEETTEPEEETTELEEETTEPEETTAPDISNTITVNSSAYETKTEFAQTNLAEIFAHYNGASEKPHAVGGKYILTGIHSLYAQADGLYAYTVKAVRALDQNGGQFVRAEIVLFKQADGTSVKGYSFHENSTGKNNIPGASGIYAAIDNGKLRLIVKAYDETATDCFENHIYEIEIPNVPNTESGTALTLADDGTTVYVLVDGDLYATVEMSGTIDYDRVIARDGTTVTFAKTAVVTLVDGTTETIENTLVVADCTKAKFGLAVRVSTLQFTEVSIQGFSTVTIPEFDNGEEPAPHEHNYESVVTAPTCTTAGYTTFTCECGDSYTGDEVAALGHSFSEGTCGVCGETDPDSVVPDVNAPAYLAKPEQLSAWASMAGDAWHCWDIVSSTMTVEDGRSFARIRVSNWDPYFVINETHNETHIGRYMAISYRTNIPATGRLLMGVGECWNNVDDLIDVDWNEDGNWHLMIVDVHTALPALSNDLITYGRFSIYEISDAYLGQATDYFDIEYIAFFDTEEAAQKYDAEVDRTHTAEPEEPEDFVGPAYLATAEQLSAWASMTGDAWHTTDIVSSTVKEEDGRTFASMRVHNADPYFVINETHNETHIGRYMAISYRTNIAAKGRLLIGVGECWNNVDDVIILDWNEDENWNLMIIDMHTALPALSNDLITYGRLSIYDNSNLYLGQETDYFDIEYVAFFDTEEDARS